jgi:hypothetical protein
MSGSSTISTPGTYGTSGVPSASSYPGSRAQAVRWFDNNGYVWMFGGHGLGSENPVGKFIYS